MSCLHILCASLLLATAACAAPVAPPTEVATAAASTAATPATTGCAQSGRGALRARVRGALDLDLAWRNAEMLCEGGLRPDGRGLRIAIAGPEQGSGRRLRFVFGIDELGEGLAAAAKPVNLTLIFEGEQRLFATRGSDKCTIDELQQRRVGSLAGPKRAWEITARGFCTGPASSPATGERIVVSRFDFVAEVVFDGEAGATLAGT